MKVTQEKLPASQIGLEIEITPEMSKQAYEKTLQEFTRSANIPGFRKGKVPRQVLIQRFGTTRIKAAVVEDLIENSLKKAVEQEKIEAIGSFELRSPFEELVSQFEPGSPLTFSAAVDVPPQVNLSTYKGLQVQAEEVKYDPAKVDEVLENYRSRSATLVPVEGRPGQPGDVAVVDFTGHLAKEDPADETEPEEIPGGSATDFEIELTPGRFIEGFIEGIIGMGVGETKDVTATFPEGYPQENLSGKPAVFTITLKELKEKELPDLDDDFAQDVSEFETLAELRESLETRFQNEADEATKTNKQEALANELVKHLEVDLPATLVKREVDYMLTQTAMRLSQQGIDVRQMFTSELVQQLRERSRPEAISRLQRTLALGEVAKKESIQVSQDEVAAKVKQLQEDAPNQDYDLERLRQVVEEDLIRDKIFAWLEENSTIELVPEGSLASAETAEGETPVASASEAIVDVTPVQDDTAKDDATQETSADPVAESAPVVESSEAPTSEAEAPPAESSKKTSKTSKKSSKKSAASEADPSSNEAAEEA
jgi:trigger factor